MDVRRRAALVARSLRTAITIRPFERGDLKRIVAIERESFGPKTPSNDAWPAAAFLEYQRASPELFLVALLGRRIAGYSIARMTWRGAEIESIAVDPRYRTRGIAQALLDATIARTRASTLRLMVSVSNDAALRFYRAYGFVRTRRVKNYYGRGRDAWRMRLVNPPRSRPKQQA